MISRHNLHNTGDHTHLSSMSHGIEGEEVIFPDLKLVPQVLQPSLHIKINIMIQIALVPQEIKTDVLWPQEMITLRH